jgi:hypothetical protein
VDCALRLGSAYWREVERFTLGLVRVRRDVAVVELRVIGRSPLLLAFGPPVTDVARRSLGCGYPITGGLPARRPGGEIVSAQDRVGDQLRLLDNHGMELGR